VEMEETKLIKPKAIVMRTRGARADELSCHEQANKVISTGVFEGAGLKANAYRRNGEQSCEVKECG
jgi:hypothetical protein